jgi:Second Messenger Oligonucleotide or Dinucleotide Synthetase domain
MAGQALGAGSSLWMGVSQRFRQSHANALLTQAQIDDGILKQGGVRACLNRHYWPAHDPLANSLVVGSWGKSTQVRPPYDIDLLFLLPYAVYQRFEGYTGNKQSALLQEVKGVLAGTYPQTTMRGDGQVVVVEFNSIIVEIAPAILLDNGQYWICETNDGGRYKTVDPIAEIRNLDSIDSTNYSNLRPVVRFAKVWQESCNVPLPSYQIELVAGDFIRQCPWRDKDWFYYDWIMRDFFEFLLTRVNGSARFPITGETVLMGDAWQSRAETALERARNACGWERYDYVERAGEEWQKIFGTMIPRSV